MQHPIIKNSLIKNIYFQFKVLWKYQIDIEVEIFKKYIKNKTVFYSSADSSKVSVCFQKKIKQQLYP